MLTLAILLLTITAMIIFVLFFSKKSIKLDPFEFVDSPKSVICSNMPIGMIVPYAGAFNKKNLEDLEKSGWLPCTGSSKLDKIYPILSDLIKNKDGDGDTPNELRNLKTDLKKISKIEKIETVPSFLSVNFIIRAK